MKQKLKVGRKNKWKKLKNVAKKVVICGAFTGFLNYFTLPIGMYVASRFSKNDIKNERIQQVCRTDSYLEDIIANIDIKNSDVLPFVNATHALAARHLSYERIFYKEMKRALKEGRGDCVSYSTFAYSNFLYLIDRFERPELKDKVRLCIGFFNSESHAWLQVYFDNKWNNYETTFDPLERNANINFRELNFLFPNDVVISNDDDSYSFSYTQFKNGKLSVYMDPLASIKSGVGCIRAFIDHLRDR